MTEEQFLVPQRTFSS